MRHVCHICNVWVIFVIYGKNGAYDIIPYDSHIYANMGESLPVSLTVYDPRALTAATDTLLLSDVTHCKSLLPIL